VKRAGTIGKKSAECIDNAQGPRLLTLKAAAGWLGLTIWAMRERIWAGDIPVIKFPGGRKMFIDRNDLEAFINTNKARIQ